MTVECENTLDASKIEDALDGLLRAILDDETRQQEARTAEPRFSLISLKELRAEMLPTRAESDILQLARDPIGAACRQGIRKCGEHLHKLGGFDLMSDVLERAADRDPSHYGARATIMDHAWNGIGEVWWS